MESHTERVGPFQILLLGLSIYVLAALFIEAVIPISASTRAILFHVDNVICVVFLYDFCFRFVQAKAKLRFLRWGWVDLVSSIPAFPILRIGRTVRIIRVLKLLRGFRSLKNIGSILFAHRAKGTILTAVFLSTLLIVFSSIMILHVENGPDANIRGAEDALWWSFVTITTVGYGDKFPVTTEGRVIGMALMLSGVGLFAVLSGAFAAWFMDADKNRRHDHLATSDEVLELLKEVRSIRSEIGKSEPTHYGAGERKGTIDDEENSDRILHL